MAIVSYRDLAVYQLSHRLAVELHRATIEKLPRFEQFEEGNQIRRSSKSICANLVEGYARRRYKAEYIKFLIYAQASCDETIEHLLLVQDTGSMSKESVQYFLQNYNDLGKKIFRFIEGVERCHRAHTQKRSE